jgi:hypothetical protein
MLYREIRRYCGGQTLLKSSVGRAAESAELWWWVKAQGRKPAASVSSATLKKEKLQGRTDPTSLRSFYRVRSENTFSCVLHQVRRISSHATHPFFSSILFFSILEPFSA